MTTRIAGRPTRSPAQLFSVPAAAARLECSEMHVYRLVSTVNSALSTSAARVRARARHASARMTLTPTSRPGRGAPVNRPRILSLTPLQRRRLAGGGPLRLGGRPGRGELRPRLA
jgi:hypothetical protein